MHFEKNSDISNLQNRLLESILVMQNDFIKRGIYYGWCKDTIENLLFLSESEFGFICELLEKEDGTPYIKSHGITNIAWDDQTRQFYEEHKENGLEFLNFESLWGKAITTGEPVIANDPDNDDRRGGYPKEQGHPKLKSFLGLPVKGSGGKVLGVMGVANRPNGYDQEVVDFLTPFLSSYGMLIEKYRSDQKRKKLEIEHEKLISDLQRSEKDLKKSKAILDATGRMAKVGGWELDTAKSEVTWTEETYRIHEVSFDYKPTLQEAINFFHPEDKGRLEKAIKRSLDHGEPFDLELRFINAKGNYLWTRTMCHPKVVDGQIVQLKGTFQDITKSKNAEEALRKSEKDLRKTQQIAQLGSWRLDLATNQVEWTKELYHMYGFDPTLPPPPYTEHMKLFTSESWERLSTSLSKTIETGMPYELELETVREDGSNGWIWVRGETISDAAGKTIGLWGAVQDITERKRAQKALQESEEKFRLAFHTSPDSINFNRLEDGVYIDINDGFTKLMGYTRQDVVGKSSLALNIWANPEDRQRLVAGLKEHGIVENLEAKFTGKNGQNKTALMSARILRINDENLILSITRDITERQQAEAERKKLQTQLNQAQKMESVGRLAGGVAHDFNNMLGVILGHTELALLQADENHDLYSDLKEIQKAANRSANITKQLLAFARKQTISPKQIDLNHTVESMLNMLRRLIGEDVDLVWKPSAHLWPVKMDPSQIDQILANLCINAKDAISGVGKLTIETGKKTFDEKYCKDNPGFIPGDFSMLAVSDNGCGMDKTTLKNLFEPFYTTKDVGKGTGLGLSTVYGIVKQNNGFINVYSEPGQGSTFKIYLSRLVVNENIDKVVPDKKPTEGGTETILLVEDEPSILRMTRMMLERKGYSVLPAATPGEAIDLAKTHADEIHLLMTDVVMPEMNGRDLAAQIMALYPGIRLMFMSGYTANVIAHHGVLDDGVTFIQKPFSMVDMTENVRELLDMAPDKNQV